VQPVPERLGDQRREVLAPSGGRPGQRSGAAATGQQLFHLVVAANRFTPDEVADIVVAAVPALSQTRQQAAASG